MLNSHRVAEGNTSLVCGQRQGALCGAFRYEDSARCYRVVLFDTKTVLGGTVWSFLIRGHYKLVQ